MRAINWGRVILGGLVAGVVINISEFILNDKVLKKDYEAVMKTMNRSAETTGAQMAVWITYGFVVGIAAIWLYAAIRSRYGAGAGTAVRAGVAVWFFAFLLQNIVMANVGIFTTSMLVLSSVWTLVEQVISTTLGASLYKEDGAPA